MKYANAKQIARVSPEPMSVHSPVHDLTPSNLGHLFSDITLT